MRLLLDTHAFIWAAVDPTRLSGPAVAGITDPDHEVFVSAVSGWEVMIKRARGRLRFPEVTTDMLATLRLAELPINLRHTAALADLPAHHRDPFDRMLIAQARAERMTLVSRDRLLEPYGVPILW